MMVRSETDGSIVMIMQNDHAQLSGPFASHWGHGTFEKPRPDASLVRAAMFHDRGWINFETSPRLMSLYICRTETLRGDRIEPVPPGYAGGTAAMRLAPRDAKTIALDPYPFDGPELVANLIHRRLTQNKFRDTAELQSVYFRTAPQIMSVRLVPA